MKTGKALPERNLLLLLVLLQLLLLSPQLNSSSGQGLLFGEWDAAAQPSIGMCGSIAAVGLLEDTIGDLKCRYGWFGSILEDINCVE